jgi:hypothetical protein
MVEVTLIKNWAYREKNVHILKGARLLVTSKKEGELERVGLIENRERKEK